MRNVDTINDRRVNVYVNSFERKERWSQAAEDADVSFSQFVHQCVECALEQGGPGFSKSGYEIKQIQKLATEIQDPWKDVKQKDIVIGRFETGSSISCRGIL